MISEAKRQLFCFNKSIEHMLQVGGKETLCAAVATCTLRVFHSPYLIPVAGAVIGFSAIQLAYKICAHYNLAFDPTETQFFQFFQLFPKLKVIAMVFAFFVVGTNPYIGMALGVSVGVVIGIELLQSRDFELSDSWMKRLWSC